MSENQNTGPTQQADLDSLILTEIQLLLSEKRTAMSVMRTGIAIFALPLSVLSVLIATSRFYDVLHVMHFLVPLVLLNAGLIGLAVNLIVHSIQRIRRYDNLIIEF